MDVPGDVTLQLIISKPDLLSFSIEGGSRQICSKIVCGGNSQGEACGF